MKVVSVVGARPQFVKLSPIAKAFERAGFDHLTIHTGQHYDRNMSAVFFEELTIPEADINLGIGSGSHGEQTGAMLVAIEHALADVRPDWVVAYGDTNSTIATALAAVKMHLPLAHLEAGLRSFNRRMPEEHNRVLTDHAADLLLCPSRVAVDNLAREGLADRTSHVGDVMVDITLSIQASLTGRELDGWGEVASEPFVLATIHRAENTDDPDRLRNIIASLQCLEVPVILAVHPRLRDRARAAGIQLAGGSVQPVDALPYRQMIAAVAAASAVVTDSGGLQKEAYVLRTPCTTVRTETEWTETLEHGWNELVPEPAEFTAERVLRELDTAPHSAPYGSGDAADRVATSLQSTY